uniref:CBM21 domain-containing protein n=1 Tax=Knipowitschia caucasica TaxID=637954 RepID=A0AAV2IUJ2_KNICA
MALCIQPTELNRLNMETIDKVESMKGYNSSTDDDDEDEEPQPPPNIRRKVSFADAFGLNLVSVKEFDNADTADSDTSLSCEWEEVISTEDFYMCCLFTVPATPEELERKVQMQMLELESIELLPKTTTLRGIVRVLNVCYSKMVYARITLDGWKSHFDLLADYVPGSSDRKTDKFAFLYHLIPPFDKDGTRVEFCLRYETSGGVFWSNNCHMNYVLFCHQKVKENESPVQDESCDCKSKKSCLKVNRRESAEEQIKDTLNAATHDTGGEHKKPPQSSAFCTCSGPLSPEDIST